MTKHTVSLAVTAVLIGAVVTVVFWCSREDHRVIYDKEGRHLPGWSLKELALAMHEYHAKHGKLPPAALRDREGKLLLSWRVLILPYLGHEELYREFNLGESWDSPHNVRLLAKMPRVFAPIDRNPPQEPHTTLFQVFVGKGTPFEDNRDWRFKDIPRMSNTILIAEAARPVLWTKPEDLPYDENRSVPDLGAIFPGQFHVVFADGTCIPGRKDVAEIDLRSAILRSGNGVWPQGNEHAEIQ